MKTIRHRWQTSGYLNWICTTCGIQKHRLLDSTKHYSYSDQSGRFIGYSLPECKSTYHNDKLN
jgi:hypothetical protein